MKKVILFLILLVLFISLGISLGVTPARKTIDFSPNLNTGGSFKIINTEEVERKLVIQTRGELAKNIILDERRINFLNGENERGVSYSITFPNKLSPGVHIGEIVISEPQENTGSDNTIVGATLSVVTQVYVYVPYPGKYAEAKLNIKNSEQGGDVIFVIPTISMGEFDLTNVYANIDIYSDLNEKIDSFNTESVSINSGDKKDLRASWKADVEIGNYKAIATLIYDGETIALEDFFQVGSQNLELTQINVNNFKLGDIAKMELLVENLWSETISKVYTQMQIFSNNNDILADFNSPETLIPALTKKVLTSYWDTAGVREGTYDTKVIIHYAGDKQVDSDLQLVVKSNEIEVIGLGYVLSSGDSGFNLSENIVMILIIVIGLLVLLNILWFFILRRAIKKK